MDWAASAPSDAERLRPFGLDLRRVGGTTTPFPMWTVRAAPAAMVEHLLSDSERQRIARFRTDALRNRYAAGHAALRLLIQARTGLRAEQQDHASDANGKPRIIGYPDVRYNISHSGERTLIGIADGIDIGVDIERFRLIEDAQEIAQTLFTRRERRILQRATTSKTRSLRFLSIWTRKEACVKAIAAGLKVPLDEFHCGADRRIVHARIGACRLRSGIVDRKDGYVISWAHRIDDVSSTTSASERHLQADRFAR